MTATTPARATSTTAPRLALQRVATIASGAIALLYALLFLGVLGIEGASDAERGILGAAAAVFAALAGLLWWRRSRLLWVGAAGLQLLLGWMYLAIAPERDPSFELWGITIRLLSLVLLGAVIGLLVAARRDRAGTSS